MDEDRRARVRSWITTALCALFVGWAAYRLGAWLDTVRSLLSGAAASGSASPAVRVVMALRPGALFGGAALAVAGLVVKEIRLQSAGLRQFVTFVVFIAVAWFWLFCVDAVLQPIEEVVRRIG